MKSRQATKQAITWLTLLTLTIACSPSNQPLSSPTPQPLPTITPTATSISTVTPTSEPSTPTPLTCLAQPGQIASGTVTSTDPPQEYMIYLPPCYGEQTDQRYPVLYLLHGQTYTADQWIRIGAPEALDQLIQSEGALPFIIVFPDDRYWNLQAGPGFGDRLVNALVPYVDENYRTIPKRGQRAIGGMSRGAGWALRLGLSRWDLFSVIGLHSLAVFQIDGGRVEKWLEQIPATAFPTVFMDIGDNDQELINAQQVESQFNTFGIPHEWHLYNGTHTEAYWRAHVAEYIAWYAAQWNKP